MLRNTSEHTFSRPPARRGHTTVETALVLVVFCMLFFGMFEYTRFLFVLHITNNASRDGARYAAVNVSMPATFNTTNYTDSAGNVYTNITSYTTSVMGGVNKQLGGFAISVYAVDPVGLAESPPVIQPDPTATSWNNTSFPNMIAVTITGTYTPIAPSILFMPSSIPMSVTGMAGCEG